MSAIFVPAVQPVSTSRFLVLAIPALLVVGAIMSTAWIDRSSSIAVEDTVVEPSPSSMF